jgi:hypothetical protein
MSQYKTHIDLNDYVQFLSPYKNWKSVNVFACPVCNGKLTKDKTNGTKFTCWDNCSHSVIRKALLSLSGEDRSQAAELRETARAEREAELARKAEQERLALLPANRKHVEVLDIIKRNPMRPESINELIEKRGFTEALIRKYEGYNTWASWSFPAVSYDGMLIQSQHKSGGSYKWIAYGQTKRHETGQNPITVHGNRINPTQIILVEGLMVKPILTAERFPECLILGASGGQFLSLIHI